jgi:diguanylate cyclase (GGDEF)-like protein
VTVPGRILLVDDGAPAGSHLVQELEARGHRVDRAPGAAVMDRAVLDRPDLLVLDGGAHCADVVRQLRADPLTAWLPVLVLSCDAHSATRALLLTSGADDVIGVPFDPLEVVARIEGVLRRFADIRSLSPLTGLPGNHRIEAEVASRAASGLPYAVCHFDLDEFKAFNDAYGFQRGDGLLLLLAACLQRAVLRAGEPPAFLGHVGGDDFVVVCLPEQAEPLATRALEEFGRLSPDHYDPADAARGHLRTTDRRGEVRATALVSVSVGIGLHRGGAGDHRAVVATAGEMKGVAKREPGSFVAIDRRG